MATQQITVSPKEQQVLRDFCHGEMTEAGDIWIGIKKEDYEGAYELSSRMREAMECLDAIGWGWESPHAIELLPGSDQAKAVVQIAERCRYREAEELAEFDAEGHQETIDLCIAMVEKVA